MLPLHLQPESHIPLYVQLRDQLRALVHSGELRSGDRIPASRELAGQLGVHRTTVANAYAELESEGLISGHVGRGTYICGTASEAVFAAASHEWEWRRHALGSAVCRRSWRRKPEPHDAGGSSGCDCVYRGAARGGVLSAGRIPQAAPTMSSAGTEANSCSWDRPTVTSR